MSVPEVNLADILIPWRELPEGEGDSRYSTEQERLAAEAREHLAITSDDIATLQSLWNDPISEVRGGARSQPINPVEVLGDVPVFYANPGGREKYANAVFSRREEIAAFINETEVGEVLPEVEALTMHEFAAQIRRRFARGGQ